MRIKAVAQAVPTFAMSVFKILLGLCEEIQKEVAKFWWGTYGKKKGIHWRSWEKLSKAKIRGGMGFRDLSSFNQALVAKQGWRIIHNPNSLVSRVMKARYFKHVDFTEAGLGSKPSFIWRSILWGRQAIQNGARWRVGNGQKVKVYSSNWLPRLSTFKHFLAPAIRVDSTVAELIDGQQR